MNELVPNQDGCAKFVPNPFKNDKCTDCGRQWTEHAGVISPELVESYLIQRQKSVDDQKQKKDNVRKEKKAKGRKIASTPSDDWFMDGPRQEDDHMTPRHDESDDECGFRMLMPGDLANNAPARPSGEMKQAKVTNLINFDVRDESESPVKPLFGADAQEHPVDGLPGSSSASSMLASRAIVSSPAETSMVGGGGAVMTLADMGAADLIQEIEHLRQMLADSNEEKAIAAEIAQEELAEKQMAIESFTRQRAEAEANFEKICGQLEAERQRAASAQKVAEEAELHRSSAQALQQEVDRLRTQLVEHEQFQGTNVSFSIDGSPVAEQAEARIMRSFSFDTPAVAERTALVSEALQICRRMRVAMSEDHADALVSPSTDSLSGDLEADLRLLLEAVNGNLVDVEKVATEKWQLVGKLRDAERKAEQPHAELAACVPPSVSLACSPEYQHPMVEAQQAAAQAMGMKANQALKEIRLHAEEQLAWISKRRRQGA